MRNRIVMTAAVALCAACGGHGGGTPVAPTQQFSRQLNATTDRIVAASVEVFGDAGIPVATADRSGGQVVSAPVDLRGSWATVGGAARADCGPAANATDASWIILAVRIQPTSGGANVTLETRRAPDVKSDDHAPCYVRSVYMTQLLDQIQARLPSTP